MIRIGIVGDIGCGKTFVANKFGYPVFNADLEVDKLYKTNRSCFRKLNKIFPKYINSFPIEKKAIGLAILKNNFNLKKIIKIVHPLVRKRMNKFPNWYPLKTAMTVVQAVGRSVRDSNDTAITYILDSDWDRFYKKNKKLFCEDFKRLIV